MIIGKVIRKSNLSYAISIRSIHNAAENWKGRCPLNSVSEGLSSVRYFRPFVSVRPVANNSPFLMEKIEVMQRVYCASLLLCHRQLLYWLNTYIPAYFNVFHC